jgi:D-sedoheptulose 7-phosphate isomerase
MERTHLLKDYLQDYISRLTDILSKIDPEKLGEVVATFIETFKNGSTIYIIGNGGSAATASHMQADFRFFIRYFTNFRPRVIALTDNVPMITAIGNDNNFEDVFVEQMRGQFVSGDVLVAISASGNSPNIVKAAAFANALGGTTIAFVGFLGGKLNEISKVSLYTPNPKGDYGPIEDVHMILNHVIVNYLSKDEEFLALQAK